MGKTQPCTGHGLGCVALNVCNGYTFVGDSVFAKRPYSQKLELSNRKSERSTQLAMQAMEDIRYAADEILRGVPQAK